MGSILHTTLADLGRHLAMTAIYMLGLMLGVLPFALWAPLPIRVAAAVLIWLGGSAYAASRATNAIDGWAIICAVIPVFMLAFGLSDYLAVRNGERVHGIPAALAPRYPEAKGFDFSDSVVQTDRSASYRATSRDRKTGRVTYTYYNIAPLTSADWTPSDPIPSWVGCKTTFSEACPGWWRDYHGGIAVETTARSGLRAAADQVLSQDQLQEAAGAPFLERVGSADAGIRQRRNVLLAGGIAAYLLWALPISALALWRCGAELRAFLAA
jgi:hypothetical protein